MKVANNPKPRPKANFRPDSRKHNQMIDTKRGGPWTPEKINWAFNEKVYRRFQKYSNEAEIQEE